MGPVARVALGIVLLAAVPGTANAQLTELPRPKGCFRGAPRPRCSWFPLVEMGVHYRLTDRTQGDEHTMVNWTLGAMANSGAHTAIGGEIFASAEGEFRAGAAFRIRRWLSPAASIDLTAGLNLIGQASGGNIRAGAPMIQARLNAGDYVAASARFDLLTIPPGACVAPYGPGNCPTTITHTSPRFYVGAELGSWPGVVGYAATAVLFVIALIAYSPPDY